LVNCCLRLLKGSPPVVALFKRNPFPERPPRYIRAVLYDYHFTDFVTRRRTGAWWRREEKGLYLPPLSLSHQEEQKEGPHVQKRGRSTPAQASPLPKA
jgi:hypothetical protein